MLDHKNISLKYQRFTTLGSKDIGIRKSEFVQRVNSFSLPVCLYPKNVKTAEPIGPNFFVSTPKEEIGLIKIEKLSLINVDFRTIT